MNFQTKVIVLHTLRLGRHTSKMALLPVFSTNFVLIYCVGDLLTVAGDLEFPMGRQADHSRSVLIV